MILNENDFHINVYGAITSSKLFFRLYENL